MMVGERFVDLPAARVRVLERDGDRERTVIFLHGLTSSASTWEPALSALPDGIRGIAYDALGSGYTERRGPRRPITRDDNRALLLALADHLGAESFRGVAHSMGCGAALGAAWRHPERVGALLLVSPATQGRRALGATIRAARFRPAARLMELAAPLFVPAMARARARELAGGATDPDSLEREAGHVLARPRQTVRGFVDIVGHSDPRRPSPESERFREISQPVWVLRGDDDLDWMPEAHEDRYRELIPDARIIRWDEVGHSPQIESPARFAALLLEFLTDTEQKKARDPGQGGAARADERGIS